jgi:hypothetical protein
VNVSTAPGPELRPVGLRTRRGGVCGRRETRSLRFFLPEGELPSWEQSFSFSGAFAPGALLHISLVVAGPHGELLRLAGRTSLSVADLKAHREFEQELDLEDPAEDETQPGKQRRSARAGDDRPLLHAAASQRLKRCSTAVQLASPSARLQARNDARWAGMSSQKVRRGCLRRLGKTRESRRSKVVDYSPGSGTRPARVVCRDMERRRVALSWAFPDIDGGRSVACGFSATTHST